MKNILLTAALLAQMATAGAQETLPKPLGSEVNKTTLMEALRNRHSTREFSERDIPAEVLSTVLWAACGVNRKGEGKITAPSALNAQDVRVYVIGKQGAFLYVPEKNSLTKVADEDLREVVAGGQPFAATAPVSLVLASDHAKFPDRLPKAAAARFGAVDCGYVSENICLACASLGLATVPRATMDTAGLKKALGLGDDIDLVINHQLGYPKGK